AFRASERSYGFRAFPFIVHSGATLFAQDTVHRGPTGRENLDCAAVPGLRYASSWAIFDPSLPGGKEYLTCTPQRKERTAITNCEKKERSCDRPGQAASLSNRIDYLT